MVSKEFSCAWPGCNRQFKRKPDLDRHRSTVHLKEKLRCPVPGCQARLSRPDKVKEHLRTHRHHSSGRDSNNAAHTIQTSISPPAHQPFEPATSIALTHFSIEPTMIDPYQTTTTDLFNNSIGTVNAGTNGLALFEKSFTGVAPATCAGAQQDSSWKQVDTSLEPNDPFFPTNIENQGALSIWTEDMCGNDEISNWPISTG